MEKESDKRREWELELERLVPKVKRNHPEASEDVIRRMLIEQGA